MDSSYHYPPELFSLLVDTIPRLNRSKRDVIQFFKNAGCKDAIVQPVSARVHSDRDSITKFEIARTVLRALNELGDPALAARREVLKRVVETTSFEMCWPEDRLEARGLVAEIRRVVNEKDAFARMHHERNDERAKRIAETHQVRSEIEQRNTVLTELHRELAAMSGIEDGPTRGRRFELWLTRLFNTLQIQIKEPFVLRSASGKAVEQIDGAVVLDGDLFLVEAKWYKERLGKENIANHLVGVYNRGNVCGLVISGSELTEGALSDMAMALTSKTVTCCLVQELLFALENRGDIVGMLRRKTIAARLERQPFKLMLEQAR